MSQTFHLSGTKCQSCEVIIERAVKKLPGVRRVDVSHAKQTLTLEADRPLASNDICPLIQKHGYGVSDQPCKSIAKTKINWKRAGGILVIVVGLYYLMDQMGLLRFGPSTSEPAGLLAVLAIGLVASVSSCTAVVGGLVIAVSSQMASIAPTPNVGNPPVSPLGKGGFDRLKPHIYFNLGRLIGFAAFGALVGWAGSAIQLGARANGLFVFTIAVLMILLGINLLELFPTNVMRMPKRLAHFIHDLAESKDPKAPMVLGALTFFLPCGFTQSMQLYALSLRDPVQAGLTMFVFALGTLPALLGIGSATSLASGKTLGRITKVAGAFVLVLGMSNLVNGATLLGFNPSKALAKVPTVSEVPVITNGTQYIQMEVSGRYGYVPDVLTVKKGVPVVWEIYGSGSLGCAGSLLSSGLGIRMGLRQGINTVKFTPQRAGKFLFSCSMGMYRGTMIVTE